MAKAKPNAKLKSWSESDRQSWKKKITDKFGTSRECFEDWYWVLSPEGETRPEELFESCADRLLEYAMESEDVQRAIESLDGPKVYHPAFYWALWQTVESTDGADYVNRKDEIEEFKKRPALAANIIGRLQALIRDQRELTEAVTADAAIYDETAPPWEPGWTLARIQMMQDVNELLVQCEQKSEYVRCSMIAPRADHLLSARQLDAKALHELFVLCEQMLGECRWNALAVLIIAISDIRRGNKEPLRKDDNELARKDKYRFFAEKLQRDEKYFRDNDGYRMAVYGMQRMMKKHAALCSLYNEGKMRGTIPDTLDMATYIFQIVSRELPDLKVMLREENASPTDN
jgi:hypothetical protein